MVQSRTVMDSLGVIPYKKSFMILWRVSVNNDELMGSQARCEYVLSAFENRTSRGSPSQFWLTHT